MAIISNEELFENYIKLYERLIFSICYSMVGDYFEAEDLAQDTFLSAYKKYDSFDGKNIKAWLTKIAANKCCDYLKSASRRTVAIDDEYLKELPEMKASPEEQVISRDAERRLLHICEQLKEPYKSVATMHFYSGVSIHQISEASGQNMKTLQTQIYRAKGMLRKLWKEEFQ